MIYLDNAATTPVSKEVLDAMIPYMCDKFGNAGATYNFGNQSYKAIENARWQVAELLGGFARNIIFTSGGSEANNLAIFGAREYLRKINKKHIIISDVEHDSVRNAALAMTRGRAESGLMDIENDDGIHPEFFIHFLPVKQDGVVDLEALQQLLNTDQIGLVSVMFVNNETGAVNPVEEIAYMCAEKGVLFHMDCVQAAGTYDIDVQKVGCDFASISSHKIHGPKGVGALYVRDRSKLNPLIYGGKMQEFGLRGGTENVAGIVGFGEAAERAQNDLEANRATVTDLKVAFYSRLIVALAEKDPDYHIIVNGRRVDEPGKILNITFPGVDAETLCFALSSTGIYVSPGSACHSKIVEPSRVLMSMGISEINAKSSVRFSFSEDNTPEDIITAAKETAQRVLILREMGVEL